MGLRAPRVVAADTALRSGVRVSDVFAACEAVADAGTPPTPVRFIAEGDYVVVEARGRNTTKEGKAHAMSYHRAPDEAVEGPDAMREWLRPALGAALRSAQRKPRTAALRRARGRPV